MEKALFNYIAKLISDYPKTDSYVHTREEELMNKFQEFRDDNVGGGRMLNGKDTGTEDMAITLATDRRLTNIERHADAVEECLSSADDTTYQIIKELYLKQNREVTVYGVAQLVSLSERAVKYRRMKFFEAVAEKLGL